MDSIAQSLTGWGKGSYAAPDLRGVCAARSVGAGGKSMYGRSRRPQQRGRIDLDVDGYRDGRRTALAADAGTAVNGMRRHRHTGRHPRKNYTDWPGEGPECPRII